MMRKFVPCAVTLAAVGLMGQAAQAHHSYAMFDPNKTIIVSGTVQKWEYVNPHASLFVVVPDKDGKEEVWGMEAPGPNTLLRAGWTRNSVKPGDKVTVELNPLRDGRTGGNMRKITLADGRFLCATPLGQPQFEAAQADPCAGTQGGPALVSVDGDARLQGEKRAVAAPGSNPSGK